MNYKDLIGHHLLQVALSSATFSAKATSQVALIWLRRDGVPESVSEHQSNQNAAYRLENAAYVLTVWSKEANPDAK